MKIYPRNARRGSLLALCVALLPAFGCYRVPAAEPESALKIWREVSAQASPSPAAGDRAIAPKATDALTLQEASTIALRHNPRLLVLRAALAGADAGIDRAGQVPNPELRLSNVRIDNIIENRSIVDIALRVHPERPGVRRARIGSARLKALVQRSDIVAAEHEVVRRVRALYSELTIASREEHLLGEQVALGNQRITLIERRLVEGASTNLDRALARTKLAEAQLALSRVRARETQGMVSLRSLLGMPPGARLALAASVVAGSITHVAGPPHTAGVLHATAAVSPHQPARGGEPDLDMLVRQALVNRPEIRAAAAQVASARARLHSEKARRYPWFSFLQAGYDVETNSDIRAFDFTVGFDLPVFSHNGGGIEESRAAVRKRRAEEREITLRIAADVAAAFARERASNARLAAMDHDLLPAALTAVRQARSAAAAGSLDPLRALDVEEILIRARQSRLRGLREHLLARAALEAALGEPTMVDMLGKPTATTP